MHHTFTNSDLSTYKIWSWYLLYILSYVLDKELPRPTTSWFQYTPTTFAAQSIINYASTGGFTNHWGIWQTWAKYHYITFNAPCLRGSGTTDHLNVWAAGQTFVQSWFTGIFADLGVSGGKLTSPCKSKFIIFRL
jgi:hypothetical protein